MAIASAKRFSRKELKQPDEFITRTTRAMNFIIERRKAFIIGTAATILITGGAWAYKTIADAKALDASNALSAAIKVYQADVKEDKDKKDDEKASDPLKGADDKKLSFPTHHERLKAALDKFDDVAKKFSGSHVALVADLYAGRCHLELGGTDAAIAAFQRFLTKSSPKDPMRFVALEALGYAYEDLKRYDEAVAKFQEFSNHEVGRTAGPKHVARVLIAQKKYKEAKDVLEVAKKAAVTAAKGKGAIETSELDNQIAAIDFWYLEP
ncbi:MAG: tetratricopeptide repeat protein [Deltaproteobacteria bacterium]|nr:tetratricopeptide repeat protein [Deltaproteobacteria bacterium]